MRHRPSPTGGAPHPAKRAATDFSPTVWGLAVLGCIAFWVVLGVLVVG